MTLAALVVLLRPTSLVLWAPLCAWHLFLEKFSLNVLKSYIVVGYAFLMLMNCLSSDIL